MNDREEFWYHYKHPDLLKANPSGMVPTIQHEDGRVVTESIVGVEFVDEFAIAGKMSSAPSLMPDDPFERAHARNMAVRMNRTVTNGYYEALVRDTDEDRRRGFDLVLEGLDEFAATLSSSSPTTSFWNGHESLTLVDCVLFPYAWRLCALETYRGFEVPETWTTYAGWLDRVTSLPSVSRTLPRKDRYLAHVKKYASGKARSKVGNAVRRGVSAVDYDDTLDGDDTRVAS